MSTGRPSALEPLRVRIRRAQFVMGLGFFSFVVGAFFSSALLMRLQPRLQAMSAALLAVLLALVISRLWVWLVLPLLGYGAARVLELKPWTTALGAALTGEGFLVAISLVSGGSGALFHSGLELLMRLLTLAGGVVLCARAIARARGESARVESAARQAAEVKKTEYQEFAVEAERIAQLHGEGASTQPPAEDIPPADEKQAGG